KATVLFEHALAKGHVGSVRGGVKFAGLVAQIEATTSDSSPAGKFTWKPGRWHEFLRWKSSASRAGPVTLERGCSYVSEPSRLVGRVVIDESKHLASRVLDSSVQSIGLPGGWLKLVAENCRIASTKILHDGTSLVGGVIVNHQGFPCQRIRKV